MKQTKWTDSENLSALNLFLDIKKSSQKPSPNHPQVIILAKTLGRSVGAIIMRLGNYEYFYSCGEHGLKNGGRNLRHFYETQYNGTETEKRTLD